MLFLWQFQLTLKMDKTYGYIVQSIIDISFSQNDTSSS